MGQNSKAKRDLKAKARAKADRARLGGTLPRADEHAGHDHGGQPHDQAAHDRGEHEPNYRAPVEDHTGHDHD
ncbi:MAG: hypothetical protein QOG52_2747 [Frankiaceae bacterium]|jgi:hypothetical protein|nr:hypothetical protein [Frankiaceae bacterium]